MTKLVIALALTLACSQHQASESTAAADPAPVEPAPIPAVDDAPTPPPAPDVEGARDRATAQDWRACTTTDDCAIVRCSCSCSGCGGFSADDIVHGDHVQDWYSAAGCSEALICPMVCCPPSELACLEGQCTSVSTATPGE